MLDFKWPIVMTTNAHTFVLMMKAMIALAGSDKTIISMISFNKLEIKWPQTVADVRPHGLGRKLDLWLIMI